MTIRSSNRFPPSRTSEAPPPPPALPPLPLRPPLGAPPLNPPLVSPAPPTKTASFSPGVTRIVAVRRPPLPPLDFSPYPVAPPPEAHVATILIVATAVATENLCSCPAYLNVR